MTDQEYLEWYDNTEYGNWSAIAYGGDGTFLTTARLNNFEKTIIPIRNYGVCAKHKNRLQSIHAFISDDKYLARKLKEYPLLRVVSDNLANTAKTVKDLMALSEICFKSADMSTCIRFDIWIDGKCYMQNVIADGFLVSTPIGAHGYYKSLTRNLFIAGIGVAFISPTYGINNLVLPESSDISIKFTRDTSVNVSCDKLVKTNIQYAAGDVIKLRYELKHYSVKVIGYDDFCCFECRKNRNSTIVNDQYFA